MSWTFKTYIAAFQFFGKLAMSFQDIMAWFHRQGLDWARRRP